MIGRRSFASGLRHQPDQPVKRWYRIAELSLRFTDTRRAILRKSMAAKLSCHLSNNACQGLQCDRRRHELTRIAPCLFVPSKCQEIRREFTNVIRWSGTLLVIFSQAGESSPRGHSGRRRSSPYTYESGLTDISRYVRSSSSHLLSDSAHSRPAR